MNHNHQHSQLKMVLTKEITSPEKLLRGGAAMKEGCRILSTTFLSLLPALSFLLLARLSTARYFSFVSNNEKKPHKFSILISLFLHSSTTLILSLLLFLVAIAAFIPGLTGNKAAFVIDERRRFHAAWILLFLIQFCLCLGICGTIDADINSYTLGNLVLPRRVVFALGLHEIVILWGRNEVKPVVDETVFGFSGEGFSRVEKVVLAVAFGNLWWRRLRDEAEALVVLPWVRAELGMSVEAVDVLGWLLYYLTVAIGGVWVVRGFFRVVMRIFRHRRQPVRSGNKATHDSSI